MFFELINEVFMGSSVFYVYFGMLLLTIGAGQLSALHFQAWKVRSSLIVNDHQGIHLDVRSCEAVGRVNEPFIMWFAKVFKRIDKLDDDKEDNKASYFKQSFKIRGGQLWRQTAYSPPFGDIATSFYW